MTIDIRKPVFDAARTAKGSGLTPDDVTILDAALDRVLLGAPVKAMTISQRGVDLIKNAEGCKLQAYLDTGGVPTIGVGHTRNVKMGDRITEAQADQFLREDLQQAMADVRRLFPVTTQGQFDALTSFVFNLGAVQVGSSTLRKKHNAGDYAGAKDEFSRWIYDNKVKLNGLVTRRQAEAELYAS